MLIPFTKTTVIGSEIGYVSEVITSLSGLAENGKFSKLCTSLLKQMVGSDHVLLTGSCTQALEIVALLLKLSPGDEVIMPSYTFVSAVNAFVIHGATPVFIDVNPSTMNIDERQLESAITSRTKAIMVMHYGGVGCNMDAITSIAKRFNLPLVEDAAQALSASYNNKPLGSFGDFSVFSFHNTKNYSCGEGGALVINNQNHVTRAEIIKDKGTNRSQFLAGMAEKYEWVDIGASYVLSELNAAYLYAHLESIKAINADRSRAWSKYKSDLTGLEKLGLIEMQKIPENCLHNSHLFFIKLRDSLERSRLITYLKERGVTASFHYSPLHTTAPGKLYGRYFGSDVYSTKESNRLLRLPIFYGINQEEVKYVVDLMYNFFSVERN
ncbi:dTDP-4-amino-4,6-dideoxygalactose transaminase [Polynucleobacter sp. AP-Ainpum-60-G11]|uniref:dTDP-4-amino-4,6-dideoxygalactose transaminase n=1 Tax=Polynucleobacter sp. AP-Ainpum-60-G11 TaxID=2576926 RepID=UPI001BFD2F0C|nr:dTDP-4-amino-4,6-dideoxygalactose transaminase [Polynucleobacter sp. AP-Ainpum-60-G11]QWE27140.1 dTDP-4-amino-4,6-dideoxygalactose transaminase [Polynucleobacter sp. AP-Ainpum-60-G11]